MLINSKTRSKLGQSGDTIVEVLLAVLVITSVMAGAFTVTSKSVKATRDSQEHAQGVKLIESELESLRAAVTNGKTIPASGAFCLVGGNVVTYSTANCTFDQTGVITPSAQPGYDTQISRCATGNTLCSTVNNDLFVVSTQWVSIANSTKATEKIFYQVYTP